ncbi:unnamed protein product, partial [marine sediment metagenome]
QLSEKMVPREYEGAGHGAAMLQIEGVSDRIIKDLDSLIE